MGDSVAELEVTRDNLPEAIEEALCWTRRVRAEPGAPLTAQYLDLASSTLERLKEQLALPPAQRDPQPSYFGASFVRDEPQFDRSLASLIMKIEDVYRRWHHQVHAR
jgi:hypothetical protein